MTVKKKKTSKAKKGKGVEIKVPTATIKIRGGSKLSRSEVVQIRLDPKLRFAAELAARKHRRTLSSFIEWAVSEAIKQVGITTVENKRLSVQEGTELVWDVHEADRFVRLARKFPYILTHEEEILWKLVRENSFRWLSPASLALKEQEWIKKLKELDFIRLRSVWEEFKKTARGELDENKLPILEHTDSPIPENFLPGE